MKVKSMNMNINNSNRQKKNYGTIAEQNYLFICDSLLRSPIESYNSIYLKNKIY